MLALECSSCRSDHDPRRLATVCDACGRSLSAQYDIGPLAERLRRGAMQDRPRSLWRYEEALPAVSPHEVVSLGEGFTPLLEAPRLANRVGLDRLWIKDEGANPTGSFKARGMSAAVTAAKARGARVLAVPSAGNAAGALAAYASRAGLQARVYVPLDCPKPNRDEVRIHGSSVTFVDGTIADAAARLRADAAENRGDPWFDMSTLKEPYRLDGKKTMGYELYEQLAGLPDVILYPTGGGTGLLGMMKAFDELEAAGLVGADRPRMIAVQSENMASIVRAFEAGATTSDPSPDGRTIASGLQVPKAFADWWILAELRRSRGRALAVSDASMITAVREVARLEGILLCPEGAALVPALLRLVDERDVERDARIVLFNTATGLKYPDVLERALSPV